MLRVVEVFRGVSILRIVAAPDVPAGHAEPQMHPVIADREALLTPIGLRLDAAVYLRQMDTGRFLLFAHRSLLRDASMTDVRLIG
jgi:hypothetical protein